jgi:hypothetical protein
MASSVPVAKPGIRAYLRSWEGLREADGVTVRGAPPAPEEFANKQVVFGDVTAPRRRAGNRWAEHATMGCSLSATVPGGGDDAEDAARTEAYRVLALVEAALAADPSAQGTVQPPGGTAVGQSDLEEAPAVGPDGANARQAVLRFTITWESHIS